MVSEGTPLRNAILGMDTRTDEENAWLSKEFGQDELFKKTGMPVHTVNTLPKLLWLKRHEMHIWDASRWFLLYEDFFNNRLCGKPQISHCLASRTQMYDTSNGNWADDIIHACKIDTDRIAHLPENSSGFVGNVLPEIAKHLGLGKGVKVFAGDHDQACAALGSGVIEPGIAMVSTGTAEVVEVVLARPVLTKALSGSGISVYRHVIADRFLAMTLNQSVGLVLRWFRDTICKDITTYACNAGLDPYDEILKEASDGPSGILTLPHFSGSGTPYPDIFSKGAVLGLTFATSRADWAKSVLEGLTFELKRNLDLLKECGIEIDELVVVGGGAKSDIWLGIKADISGIPLIVPKTAEAASLGAAILAGIGLGIFETPEKAVNEMVSIDKSIEPKAANMKKHNKTYNLYRGLYPSIKDILHQL